MVIMVLVLAILGIVFAAVAFKIGKNSMSIELERLKKSHDELRKEYLSLGKQHLSLGKQLLGSNHDFFIVALQLGLIEYLLGFKDHMTYAGLIAMLVQGNIDDLTINEAFDDMEQGLNFSTSRSDVKKQEAQELRGKTLMVARKFREIRQSNLAKAKSGTGQDTVSSIAVAEEKNSEVLAQVNKILYGKTDNSNI